MQAKFSTFDSLKELVSPLPAPRTVVDEKVLREMQSQFVRLMLPMAFVNFGNATAVALSYIAVVDLWRVLGWYGVMTTFCVLQFMAGLKFNRTKMPEKVSGRLLRKAETMSIVLGMIWGVLPFIFNDDNHLSHLFLNFVIAGMCAGTVAILGPVCRISIRFLFGAIPLVYAANMWSDSPYAMPITFLTTALMFAVVVGATRNAHHVREMIEREVDADTARQQMLDAIESTTDAFAFFDKDDRLILANQRHINLIGDDLRLNDSAESRFGSNTIKHAGRWLLQARHPAPDDGYVLVHTDITDLKMRERELVEARKEAEEADAAKTRFLSTMSHELRSPLNIILGFSRLMASDSKVDLSWDDVAEYSDSINASSAHLLQLIDDIIDYSKLGLDKFLLEPSAVNIRDLLESTVTLAASFEHVKDKSAFDIQVAEDLQTLRVDESICKRVVMNLISNAIRYRGEDQRIIIRAGLGRDGDPFITVRDFGEGIPEAEIEHVFEAFYQSKSARKHGRGGTGLGLTLCRHLARLHDGDVILKSRVGAGTTASFVLPRAAYIEPAETLEHPGVISLSDEAAA